MSFFAKLISSGFYSGYAPFAPGTFGSLLAAILLFVLQVFFPSYFWLPAILFLLSFVLGVWSSHRYSADVKKKDPSEVVIDEWAGYYLTYFITLIFIPNSWYVTAEIFLAFRLFDIAKPFPVGKSQELSGGWGIMMDDVLAAGYAALLVVAGNKIWQMF